MDRHSPAGRRLTAPWIAELVVGGYRVSTADGVLLAVVHAGGMDRKNWARGGLTYDEARRVAAQIARLPELLTIERQVRALDGAEDSRAFRVLAWSHDQQRVDEVVATAGNFAIGKAAFEAALPLRPKVLITLQDGIRVAASRPVPPPQPPDNPTPAVALPLHRPD